VRYKGLAKNTAQLHTLFALANLMIAKRRLLALNGASCVLNRTKGTEMAERRKKARGFGLVWQKSRPVVEKCRGLAIGGASEIS
jgi:IS5 family transposase